MTDGGTHDGRVALVTGGASGIGRAIAERLARDGATVVIGDMDPDGRERMPASLTGATYVRADLTQASDRDRLVEAALAAHGRIDILVNNAGIQHVAPIHEFPPERWEYLIALHLVAPAMLIRAVLPGMYERGWGRIVNLGSINALTAQPNKSAYVAAKHGLLGLTKAVALEAGPHGVTVNAVCPAFVRTPLVERQIGDLARTEGIPIDDVVSRVMLEPSAIKRLIEPAEVAACAVKLLTDDVTNGETIVLDGS